MSVALEVLQETSPLFLTQIAARTGWRVDELADDLADEPARVLVVHHVPPDPHLDIDLRIAAVVSDGDLRGAATAADVLWRRWLQDFLQAHRCS